LTSSTSQLLPTESLTFSDTISFTIIKDNQPLTELLSFTDIVATRLFSSFKANDTFTEASTTSLEDHTPSPLGTSWSESSAGPDKWKVTDKESNHTNEAGGSANVVRENTDIGGDVMDVTLVVTATKCDGGAGTGYAGPAGRIPSGTVDGDNFYAARLYSDGSNCDVELVKNVGGSETQLGTYDANFGTSTDVTLKLEIRTATKKVFVDGIERISSSDDSLTGNNFAGMAAFKDLWRMDDFVSYNPPFQDQTESLSFVDTVTTAFATSEDLTESLSFTDTVSAVLGSKVFPESLTFTDT